MKAPAFSGADLLQGCLETLLGEWLSQEANSIGELRLEDDYIVRESGNKQHAETRMFPQQFVGEIDSTLVIENDIDNDTEIVVRLCCKERARLSNRVSLHDPVAVAFERAGDVLNNRGVVVHDQISSLHQRMMRLLVRSPCRHRNRRAGGRGRFQQRMQLRQEVGRLPGFRDKCAAAHPCQLIRRGRNQRRHEENGSRDACLPKSRSDFESGVGSQTQVHHEHVRLPLRDALGEPRRVRRDIADRQIRLGIEQGTQACGEERVVIDNQHPVSGWSGRFAGPQLHARGESGPPEPTTLRASTLNSGTRHRFGHHPSSVSGIQFRQAEVLPAFDHPVREDASLLRPAVNHRMAVRKLSNRTCKLLAGISLTPPTPSGKPFRCRRTRQSFPLPAVSPVLSPKPAVVVLSSAATQAFEPAALLQHLMSLLDIAVWEAWDQPLELIAFRVGRTAGAATAFTLEPEQMAPAAAWAESVHPRDRTRLAGFLASSAVHSGTPIDYRLIVAEGELLWVRHWLLALTPEANGRNRLYGLLMAIPEQKHLEWECLRVSEHECNRIGQELHDDLCQVLAGLTFKMRVVGQHAAKHAPALIGEIGELDTHLTAATDRVRSMAHGLFPAQLNYASLRHALKEFARQISTRFSVPVELELPAKLPAHTSDQIIHLFRIAQEAASNAVRHGNATAIRLVVAAGPAEVQLTVEDNGRGFPSNAVRPEGIGIHIMQYRAGVLGGRLEFRNLLPQGTAVQLTYPIARSLSHKPANLRSH